MRRREAEIQPIEEPRIPIVYLMVGPMYATPHDFSDEFSGEFGVTKIPNAKAFPELDRKGALQEVNRLTLGALCNSEDIIFEKHLPEREQRIDRVERVRRARIGNATIVAFSFWTPYSELKQRLEKRMRDEAFDESSVRRHVNAFNNTLTRLVRPTTQEGIDHIVDIDGGGETDEILDQVEYKLFDLGIVSSLSDQ